MGRENKKEAVAALHREQILKAAEALFSEKGFAQTTIEDISGASAYSRRTIYAYYDGKEDILHHIVEKGLLSLKREVEEAVRLPAPFLVRYEAICLAMRHYQSECPQSWQNVSKAKTAGGDSAAPSDTVRRIFELGTVINRLLADFIAQGQASGAVRPDVVPMMTVYVLWSSVSALISLVQTKGPFICQQFSVTEEAFYAYGFRQIIQSILEVKR